MAARPPTPHQIPHTDSTENDSSQESSNVEDTTPQDAGRYENIIKEPKFVPPTSESNANSDEQQGTLPFSDLEAKKAQFLELQELTKKFSQEYDRLDHLFTEKSRLLDTARFETEKSVQEKENLLRELDILTAQLGTMRAHSSTSHDSVASRTRRNFESGEIERTRLEPTPQLSKSDIERQKWTTQQARLTNVIDNQNKNFTRYRRVNKDYSTDSSHEPLSSQDEHFYREPIKPKKVPFESKDDQLESKVVLLDDWKKVEMKTPHQDQLAHREKLIVNQTASLTQQNLMLSILEKIQPHQQLQSSPQSKELDSLISLAKDTISEQQKHIDKMSKELASTKKAAELHVTTLEKPTVWEFVDYSINGTSVALQAKNITSAITPFDPDSNPNQDFACTWRKILMYTANFKLDEKAYKDILNIVVQGSAAQVLFELSQEQKSLKDILKTFATLYARKRTIVQDVDALNNFKRKPSEPIQVAMQRARIMAERVRQLWPEAIWDNFKRMEVLSSILKQIIDTKTRAMLECEEHKFLKSGVNLEYEALLDLVETYESSHDLIPKSEAKLTINVCRGVPKIDTEPRTSTPLPLHPIEPNNPFSYPPKQNDRNQSYQKFETDKFAPRRARNDSTGFEPRTFRRDSRPPSRSTSPISSRSASNERSISRPPSRDRNFDRSYSRYDRRSHDRDISRDRLSRGRDEKRFTHRLDTQRNGSSGRSNNEHRNISFNTNAKNNSSNERFRSKSPFQKRHPTPYNRDFSQHKGSYPDRNRSKSPYNNRFRSTSPYENRDRSKGNYNDRYGNNSSYQNRNRSKSPYRSNYRNDFRSKSPHNQSFQRNRSMSPHNQQNGYRKNRTDMYQCNECKTVRPVNIYCCHNDSKQKMDQSPNLN